MIFTAGAGAFTKHSQSERDLPRYAVNGERAEQSKGLATFRCVDVFTASGIKCDFRKLLDVKEVGAAEMLVALRVVRVKAVGADHHLKSRIGWVSFIDLVLATDVAEHAVRIAKAGVGRAENDRCMFGIDLVKIGREGGRRDDQERDDGQPGV